MSDQKDVLVIDDEPDIRELLSMTLHHMHLSSDLAENYQQALTLIDKYDYLLVITDMRLPDGSGFDVVRYIQRHKPQMPVAVITAYGNIEGAVNTLKAGAFDYVSKPIDLTILKGMVQTALKLKQLNPAPRNELLVGESPCMNALRESIIKLARSQAPVFIHGESGVGKELVAHLIHANSPRANKPFIPVNCAAISSELMESEFFGHVKGSFTGAIANKEGLFSAANGGTLFLDEIAELPLPMQVKLLRAIQEHAVKPVGGINEYPIDVRVLSASNKNLQDEIKAGRFRQELYYRINVIELNVPSLKERLSDVPLLADAILNRLAAKQNTQPLTLSDECIKALQSYHFPGNVRELENILERAMALCNGEEIKVVDLQLDHSREVLISPLSNSESEGIDSAPNLLYETQSRTLEDQLIFHEKEMIMKALESTKWNRTAAAKLLGISFRMLRYKLKKLGIE